MGDPKVRTRREGWRRPLGIVAIVLVSSVVLAVVGSLILQAPKVQHGLPCNGCHHSGPILGSSGICKGPAAAQSCSYTFSIQQASSGLTANNIKFQLQDALGNIANVKVVNVTLIDVSGCGVGTATIAAGTWAAAAAPFTACSGAITTGTPISSGDQLSLQTVVSASSPSLSGQGYQLIVIGVGSFSGTETAGIP